MGRIFRSPGLVLVLVAVAALAFALPVGGQDSARQPLAEIPDNHFDFGEVFEKAEYKHVFVVRNRGKAELLIEDVKPG